MGNVIVDKSKYFAIRIVKLCRTLRENRNEYVLSKQLIRSGTSIGANVKESVNAQSEADFYSKMSIALKEAGESEYWLELLYKTEYISESEFKSLTYDCKEIIRILTSINKKNKNNIYNRI